MRRHNAPVALLATILALPATVSALTAPARAEVDTAIASRTSARQLVTSAQGCDEEDRRVGKQIRKISPQVLNAVPLPACVIASTTSGVRDSWLDGGKRSAMWSVRWPLGGYFAGPLDTLAPRWLGLAVLKAYGMIPNLGCPRCASEDSPMSQYKPRKARYRTQGGWYYLRNMTWRSWSSSRATGWTPTRHGRVKIVLARPTPSGYFTRLQYDGRWFDIYLPDNVKVRF